MGIVTGKEFASWASRRVREDLRKYRLLVSEDKSEWEVCREVIWTGLVWNTVEYKLFFPEEKLQRAEGLIKEALEGSARSMTVRRIAKVAGLIGSFSLAMGNAARFYSRGMLTQVAKVVGKEG